MSYARLSEESDVYLWPDMTGRLHCSWCALKKDDRTASGELIFASARAATAHLREHLAAGDKVPERAFRELRRDALSLWWTRLVFALKRAWSANWSTP